MESPEFYTARPLIEPDKDTISTTQKNPLSEDIIKPSEDIVIDIKPELNIREKQTDFASLLRQYEGLTSKKFVEASNSETLNLLSKQFRENLEEFKIKYYTEDLKPSLDIFEKSVQDGQIKLVELYNEPKNFNDTIPIKSYDELFEITDLNIISKTSSSDSFMFKGKFLGQPCFIKSFFLPNKNLEYEQKIYRYILTRNEEIKPLYEDYFVKVLNVYKTQSIDFKFFLDHNRITSTDKLVFWNKVSPKLEKNLNSNMYAYLIITEDIEGETYYDFYKKNYQNENLITNTFFDMLYGIYIMNYRLKIMHNDNHFYNVLIKINLPSKIAKYEINDYQYFKNKAYRICFFDFDMSFLNEEQNPYLDNDTWLIQNKMSAKDIWTTLNSLINLNVSIRVTPPYIDNIINVIVNYSDKHLKLLKQIYEESQKNNKYWNGYCENNIQSPCVIPNESFLYPSEVLTRYIRNEHINKILNFVDTDVFYQKYLKYKKKYLELKALKF